jgi:hypothetical protein
MAALYINPVEDKKLIKGNASKKSKKAGYQP